MLGVETSHLSRNLPTALKVLICNMSIGFVVYCKGAREAEFDNNGIQNRRDLKCLLEKFCFEPPKKNDWTCWPCLDFLRKSKSELFRKRRGLEYPYSSKTKVQRPGKPPYFRMKKKTHTERDEYKLSENVESAILMKFSFGEIKISGDSNNNSSPFRVNSSGYE